MRLQSQTSASRERPSGYNKEQSDFQNHPRSAEDSYNNNNNKINIFYIDE